MIERLRSYMTSRIPASASPEIEILRASIRRHEETIRLLEIELSETRRVLEQKIERLIRLLEPRDSGV